MKTFNTLLDEFEKKLFEWDLQPNQGCSVNEIDAFEREHGIYLPENVKQYFVRINGTSGWDGLTKLWAFEEVLTLLQRFEECLRHISPFEWVLDDELPSPNDEWWMARNITDPNTTTSQTDPLDILSTTHPFIIFGDYNIDASHWGVRCSNRGVLDGPVISVYGFLNHERLTYHLVADSLSSFIQQYLEDGPDGMI